MIDDKEFAISTVSYICMNCVHFRPASDGRTCDAFPRQIPLSIWNGDNDHKKPYRGDHGIQFESRSDQ